MKEEEETVLLKIYFQLFQLLAAPSSPPPSHIRYRMQPAFVDAVLVWLGVLVLVGFARYVALAVLDSLGWPPSG